MKAHDKIPVHPHKLSKYFITCMNSWVVMMHIIGAIVARYMKCYNSD